jgi:protein SCO1/2
MNRRNFFRAGLTAPAATTLGLASTLGAGPAIAAPERRQSLAARQGFLPNVPLVSHTGEKVHFYDDLVGDRLFLLNFFVVACPEGRCPAANATLKELHKLFGERMGRDVFFYSVTLQPEQDTQPILKEYAEEIVEAGPGWLFLTGTPADIDRLRRAQGFYDPDPIRDADVNNHSSMARVGRDSTNRWSMAMLIGVSARHIYTSMKSF